MGRKEVGVCVQGYLLEACAAVASAESFEVDRMKVRMSPTKRVAVMAVTCAVLFLIVKLKQTASRKTAEVYRSKVWHAVAETLAKELRGTSVVGYSRRCRDLRRYRKAFSLALLNKALLNLCEQQVGVAGLHVMQLVLKVNGERRRQRHRPQQVRKVEHAQRQRQHQIRRCARPHCRTCKCQFLIFYLVCTRGDGRKSDRIIATGCLSELS